jgi:hypothetical protein
MRIGFVALVAALAAGPAIAKPKIENIQASHGQLGPERKSLEYLRGDEVYIRFTVSGFTTDADGRMNGEMTLNVTDSAGKEVLKQAFPLQQLLALGGGTFPGFTRVILGHEMPVGEYTIRVTMTDNLAKESDSFERKFTCKAEEFSLVAVRFWQDADGKIPATVGGTASQTLFIRARGVGFDKSKGEIDVEMELEVMDAKGKAVMPKPIKTVVHNEDPAVVPTATVINLRAELALNRPGDFVLKIKHLPPRPRQ